MRSGLMPSLIHHIARRDRPATPVKAAFGVLVVGAVVDMHGQQIAAGVVHDGQWIAPVTIGCLELAFVVCTPHPIGLLARSQGLGRRHGASAYTPAANKPLSLQYVVDGGFAGCLLWAPTLQEQSVQLLGPHL